MTCRGETRSVAHRGENGAAHRVIERAAFGRAALVALPVLTLLASLCLADGLAHAQVYSFRDRGGTQHFTNVPSDTRFRAMAMERAHVITRLPYTGRANNDGFGVPRSDSLARADRLWTAPPADLERMIDLTAQRYGVETALVHAVVRAESDFDHLAISSSGAQGLMQLMPGTASEVGVRNAFQPQENLAGGVYYLRQLLDRFGGNTQLAVAGYNAGPGAVERFGGVPPYSETLDYLERVFRFRQEYLLSHRPERTRVVVASR
jgi:soluble lytic murein transglycosylase-like protein